jgi:hypothetical protein
MMISFCVCEDIRDLLHASARAMLRGPVRDARIRRACSSGHGHMKLHSMRSTLQRGQRHTVPVVGSKKSINQLALLPSHASRVTGPINQLNRRMKSQLYCTLPHMPSQAHSSTPPPTFTASHIITASPTHSLVFCVHTNSPLNKY